MRKLALALACSFALVPFMNASTEAQSACRERMMAKGEPSRIQLLAKRNARNAWSEKVRNTKRLGEEYANWKSARDSRVDCTKETRHICRASARPCKA
jgi:hypothetical protein